MAKNMNVVDAESRKEKYKVLVIAALIGISFLLTYYFHVVLKTGIIFTHFFYIPVILSALWWKRKGLWVPIVLCLFLFYSHIFFRETADYFRILMLLLIFLVIAVLNEKISRSEEKLRETSDYLENLIEYANAPIIVWDLNFRITRANHAFERLTGYKVEEVIGQRIDMFFPEGNRKESLNKVKSTLDGKYWEVEEILIRRKDEAVRVILWNSANIYDKITNNFLATIAQGQDITERNEIQERLYQSEKLSAVGQLAAGVAHNYNNLIGALRNYFSLLITEEKNSDNWRDYIDKIQTIINHSAQISDDILSFARVGKKREEEIFIIENELLEIIRILQQTFPANIKVKVEIDSGSTAIKCNLGQFLQMVMNFCLNAKDAMPGGGELKIYSRKTMINLDSKKQTNYAKSGEYCVVQICDSGSGIKKKYLARVFEPFFTTKESKKGTGLGLSTAYGFIKDLGGFIDVNSNLGRGTVFSVYLPIKNEKAFTEKIKLGSHSQNDNQNIMIIDDDENFLNSAVSLLRKEGYLVFSANKPIQALDEYKNVYEMIDIVIVDLVMPEINGCELLKKMRCINEKIKAVILREKSSSKLKITDELRKIIYAELVKPIDIKELVQVIKKV